MEFQLTQSEALTVEAGEERLRALGPDSAWDLSPLAGEWALMARGLEKQQLLLALTARGCPRSERLLEQYTDFWEVIANDTFLVNLVGGSLEGPHYSALQLGDLRVQFPMVPAQVLVASGDPLALPFRALGVGPFEGDYTRDEMLAFLEGKSRWVRDAADTSILLRRGGIVVALDRSNAFHCAVTANLGSPTED